MIYFALACHRRSDGVARVRFRRGGPVLVLRGVHVTGVACYEVRG